MAKVSIRLMPSARQHTHSPEALREAAMATFAAAGGGDIRVLAFSCEGRHYALSTRIVVEVDWLPGRVPPRVLREPSDKRLPPRRRRP